MSMKTSREYCLTIAVDASNIRAGGGVTHLVECLSALDAAEMGIKKVVVYGGPETLARLPERHWLEKNCPRLLCGGAGKRMWWRQTELTKAVRGVADVLLVPGGSYTGSFRPYVALAQNLLPFDFYEKRREGLTWKAARLRLLCSMQTQTFRHADGVIYMTEISRDQIERSMGVCARRSRVVHHGTNPRFFRSRSPGKNKAEFTPASPFRLLYVSILEPYKHQEIVVDAVGELRKRGSPVVLDLVGPGSPRDQRDLRARIRRWDPKESAIKYHGSVPYDQLEAVYGTADAFIFASSCETFGMILLEAMAGGLPVLCSHRSAMPEVAGSAAVYFDPMDARSLTSVICRVMENDALRRSLSFQAQQQAAKYSWERCARNTFGFVREVHADYHGDVGSQF